MLFILYYLLTSYWIIEGSFINQKEILENQYIIRKCCLQSYYYSLPNQSCVDIGGNNVFDSFIHKYILPMSNNSFTIIPGRIETCPTSFIKPQVTEISDELSYRIVDDGALYIIDLDYTLTKKNYCLEAVDTGVDNVSLMIAYCIGLHEISPKCCPEGYIFDLKFYECVPSPSEHLKDFMHPNNQENKLKLQYRYDLECSDFPVEVPINETYFLNNKLCITKSDYCYNDLEYCIDYTVAYDILKLHPSVHLCPKNFVNKCCPDGQSLNINGCQDTNGYSLAIQRILGNSRFHVKSISQLNSNCHPVLLKDSYKSYYNWNIDRHGNAILTYHNKTLQTRNYCIDDFVIQGMNVPSIKICSSSIELNYPEINNAVPSRNDIGKCCPTKSFLMLGNSRENSKCIESPLDIKEIMLNNYLKIYNISQIIFSGFPDCLSEYSHHVYKFNSSSDEQIGLTKSLSLQVTTRLNKCSIRENHLSKSFYCVDLINEDNEFRPVALSCGSRKINSFSERNIVLAIFLMISSISLAVASISIYFARVRRGMVTIKKVRNIWHRK